MAKAAETSTHEQEIAEQAQRELRALPPDAKLTFDEAMSFVQRLGIRMPEGWSSADDIRELRGPLPEDDPDFVNVDRR